MPSTPGLPLLALTRANACLQFSRSQTSSINGSPMAGLLALRFAVSDSVPSPEAVGASLLLLLQEGQLELVLLPLVAHELRCLLATPINPLRGPFGPSSALTDYFALC